VAAVAGAAVDAAPNENVELLAGVLDVAGCDVVLPPKENEGVAVLELVEGFDVPVVPNEKDGAVDDVEVAVDAPVPPDPKENPVVEGAAPEAAEVAGVVFAPNCGVVVEVVVLPPKENDGVAVLAVAAGVLPPNENDPVAGAVVKDGVDVLVVFPPKEKFVVVG